MGNQSARKPRIALLVDNPYRDLPGLVLVSWTLCQNGATCYLLPVNLRYRELWPLAPDFILLNHFRTIYEDFIKNVMEAGIMVGVLDTEGSIFSPVPKEANVELGNSKQADIGIESPLQEYALSMARDSNLRHNIACFCAWTPLFARYAGRAGWYYPEQITVTGTPRMDFYALQWHDAARRMSPYADVYPGPMILINSSFTLANPRFQSAEKEAEMMVTKFSYDPEFVDKWKQTQATALELLSSLANKLAQHFSDVTFVFRPHPFEGEDIYRKLLKPLPNLNIVTRGTVDGWLLRAKALIHWGSSTAIDSCLAGVPAFTAGWIPAHLPVPAVDSVSIKCSDENELIEYINDVLNSHYKQPPELSKNIKKVIEENFYKIDGNAHKRVADAILKAVSSKTHGPSLRKCRDMFYGDGYSLIDRATISVKKAFSISPHWSFRYWREITGELAWDRSDKYFDADQVRSMLEAIAAGARSDTKEPLQSIGVQPAREHGDYRFGYRQGRSVTVFPQ
jgi:surface carbohydrate biosynthesis protein